MRARREALWRLLAANRDYRLLVSAGLISLVGDYVLGVGLTFLVYQITGSTLASGGMLLASFLPSILLGSLAGVMVDRWNRRTTMIVANLAQVVGLVPLLAVHDSSTIWIVYLVGAYQGCVEQFFMPAEQAIIPHLVPKEDLVGANGVNAQMRNLARLVGSAIGGDPGHRRRHLRPGDLRRGLVRPRRRAADRGSGTGRRRSSRRPRSMRSWLACPACSRSGAPGCAPAWAAGRCSSS